MVIAACSGGAAQQPAPKTPAPVTGPSSPPVAAASPDFLPAGLYFRDGYLRYQVQAPPPRVAAVGGVFADPPSAEKYVVELAAAGLPPGYPLIVHSDELGLVDERITGIIVVVGLFASQPAADAWAASAPIKAELLPLLAYEESFARTVEPEFRVVHVIASGPAYPRPAIDAAEEAYQNWETKRGPDPLAHPPDTALCQVAAGQLYLVHDRDLYTHGRRWVPVLCGTEPAYIKRDLTALETLIFRTDGNRYRAVQVTEVECDVPTFRNWIIDTDRTRREVPVRVARGGC